MIPTSRPGEAPEQSYDKNDYTYGGRNAIAKQKDTRIVFPSADNSVKGRVLPSYDFSLNPNDAAFAESWGPYRDKDLISASGHPAFNYWFYDQFEVYRFWGPQNRSFISPRTKVRMGAATRREILDPIDRMNDIVRKNPGKWSTMAPHIKSSGDLKVFKPLLLLPSEIGFCNFFGTAGDDVEPGNFLIGMSGGGFQYIMNQLQKFTVPGTTPRDPNWPTYLLGDVTHPTTGLKAWSGQKSLSAAGRPANVLLFSTKEDFLSGHEELPVDVNALKGRRNFLDLDNVMHIPSLEEMVEWIVEVPEIPIELLREAVNGRVPVPDRTNATTSVPNSAPKQETKQETATSANAQKPLPFVSKAPVEEETTPPWEDKDTNDDTPTFEKTGGGLSKDEEAEFEILAKLVATGKIGDAGPTGFSRYFELMQKAAGEG